MKKLRKMTALFLAAVMAAASLSVNAFADDTISGNSEPEIASEQYYEENDSITADGELTEDIGSEVETDSNIDNDDVTVEENDNSDNGAEEASQSEPSEEVEDRSDTSDSSEAEDVSEADTSSENISEGTTEEVLQTSINTIDELSDENESENSDYGIMLLTMNNYYMQFGKLGYNPFSYPNIKIDGAPLGGSGWDYSGESHLAGDINGDGSTNLVDGVALLNILAICNSVKSQMGGLGVYGTGYAEAMRYANDNNYSIDPLHADIDGNGTVDYVDAYMLFSGEYTYAPIARFLNINVVDRSGKDVYAWFGKNIDFDGQYKDIVSGTRPYKSEDKGDKVIEYYISDATNSSGKDINAFLKEWDLNKFPYELPDEKFTCTVTQKERKYVNVNFHNNSPASGGSETISSTKRILQGEKIYCEPLSRSDYDSSSNFAFDGWYTSSGCEVGTEFCDDSGYNKNPINEDTDVYAKWVAAADGNIRLNIYFKKPLHLTGEDYYPNVEPGDWVHNGLSGSYSRKIKTNSYYLNPDSKTHTFDYQYVTGLNSYEDIYDMRYYDFEGYYFSSDFSADSYYNTWTDMSDFKLDAFSKNLDRLFPENSDEVTLYMKFTPKTYNVTYDLNYPTSDRTYMTEEATYAEGFEFPDDPNREGYIFDGWYYDPSCHNEVNDNLESRQRDSLTLYAKWTPNYYIEFHLQYTPTGSMNDIYSTNDGKWEDLFGDEFYNHFLVPERENHTFDGWFFDVGGTSPLNRSQPPENKGTEENPLKLYAKWTPLVINVNYHVGDDIWRSTTESIGNAGFENYPEEPLHKSYEYFDGWYTEDGEQYDEYSEVPDTDLDLYAKFAPYNIYVMVYDYIEDGELVDHDISTDTYEMFTLKDSLTRKSYVFEGYFTDPDFHTPYNEESLLNSINGDNYNNEISIYVKWRRLEPNLSITKTVDKAKARSGDILTYTITVTNTSPDGYGEDVVITDDLPQGITFVSADGGSYDSGSVKWTIPEIVPNGSAVLTLKATLN